MWKRKLSKYTKWCNFFFQNVGLMNSYSLYIYFLNGKIKLFESIKTKYNKEIVKMLVHKITREHRLKIIC